MDTTDPIERIESNVETGEIRYFDENEQQVPPPPEPAPEPAPEP